MSSKPRHRRTPDQRRRRLGAPGTAVGIAVGAAMAAAFVSLGNASADDTLAAGTDDLAFTEMAQATDPTAVTDATVVTDPFTDPTAFAAAAVTAQATDEDAFEQLVLTIDPNAFTATGDPNDFLGALASQIDSDLANTVFGPEINTI